MTDAAQAWLVVGRDGHRSVFIDRATADRYAARVHGVVYPLFHGQRKDDGKADE